MDDVELLGCPFCSGRAAVDKTRYGRPVMRWVKCAGCEASSTAYARAEDAIAAWNRRAPASEEVRGALEEAVHAWIREDLDTGAKMLIGFHGPKLIERLAACTVSGMSLHGDTQALSRDGGER